jgi:hypothetical protein
MPLVQGYTLSRRLSVDSRLCCDLCQRSSRIALVGIQQCSEISVAEGDASSDDAIPIELVLSPDANAGSLYDF